MRSVEILRQEHALMQRMLGCLERAAQAAQSGGPVKDDLFRKAFEFARGFVHGAHQAKEEIFSRSATECGLAGADADELSGALAFVGAAVRALPGTLQGDPTARRLLSENAKAYVGLARSHVIGREGLLEAAERALSEDDDRVLLSLFAVAEGEFTGAADSHYVQLVDEIEECGWESGGGATSREAAPRQERW